MKLIALLLFLLPSAAFTQGFTFNAGGPIEKNYYQEIPYENVNGKLFLSCTIGGKPHRFLFDTGAVCTIEPELAHQLNLPVLTKVSLYDVFSKTDSTASVELNGLKLGNITFDKVPAITFFPSFYKCYNIDGVIGSNLLRNSFVSIDSRRHLIIITDQKDKLALNEQHSAPLVTDVGEQSDPKIRFFFSDKISVQMAFDTGDSRFMRFNDELAKQIVPYHFIDSLTTGYGASGIGLHGMQTAIQQHTYKLVPFSIGNAKFTNAITISSKSSLPGIGSKLLDYGVITLDFINKKFYFDAYQMDNILSDKHWNASYAFDNGKLVIAIIWKTAEGLVELGDQVLAVDDQDCSHITFCDSLNKWWPLLDGKQTAQLTIRTAKGDVKKVTIKKE